MAETLAASLLPPCLLPAQVRWRAGEACRGSEHGSMGPLAGAEVRVD